MIRTALLALSMCLSLLDSAALLAAETLTPNTLKLAKDEASPQATIDEMAWYAGTWRGTGLGGDNEEIWSAPRHGSMMGMYRLLVDDRPVFYEFLTLGEEQDSLTLRIKHFHPDLRGWEHRDESMQMRLVAKRNGRYYFEGLTFETNAARDAVTIYLAVQPKNETLREEVFRYERQ